jgi:hypothetical protein
MHTDASNPLHDPWCHHPTHKNTKRIVLPQLAKIYQVNLEPVSKSPLLDRLDAALDIPRNRIFLHARQADLTVQLHTSLSDIVILLTAIRPCALLTHMAIPLMPLINSIEELFPRENHAILALVLP